ncbi:hypothetical protein FOZ63_021055, partial [Perkinsus olseni]
MAVLRCAGYRSAGCYLSAIISYNRDQGHVMDSATEAAVRRARLACKRNLGPPTRMRGISLAELRLLASKLTGFYAKQRVAGYLMASWFLLRCSEALSMDMQHIRFDEGSKTVSVTIASSKVDQAAEGCVRRHGCLCTSNSDRNASICPYHVLWHLCLTRKLQRACPGSAVLANERGNRFLKKEFLECFRRDARESGIVVGPNCTL